MKVERFGEEVQGVRLEGDRRNPEPVHFRVMFPGGDVEIVRTTADDYWIHIRVNDEREKVAIPEAIAGKLTDARLDIRGKHASETDAGDFAHPELYHLAVRVEPQGKMRTLEEALPRRARSKGKSRAEGEIDPFEI